MEQKQDKKAKTNASTKETKTKKTTVDSSKAQVKKATPTKNTTNTKKATEKSAEQKKETITPKKSNTQDKKTPIQTEKAKQKPKLNTNKTETKKEAPKKTAVDTTKTQAKTTKPKANIDKTPEKNTSTKKTTDKKTTNTKKTTETKTNSQKKDAAILSQVKKVSEKNEITEQKKSSVPEINKTTKTDQITKTIITPEIQLKNTIAQLKEEQLKSQQKEKQQKEENQNKIELEIKKETIENKELIIEKQELIKKINEELKKSQEQENIISKPKKKKRKLKKKVYKIILFTLIIIWLFSVYKIATWYIDNKQVETQTEEIHEIAPVKEIDSGEEINPPENKFDPYWDFIKIPLVSVDFSKLTKQNSDTVGWIFVDSSNINYPVVQTTDNDFYLNHGFDKQYNDAGWVFMDYRNNSENFGKNTILYAHSRIDRSLFGTLRNATKEEWFNDKNNHIIKFSTPYENTMWMVFSSYTIEAEGYYLKTDFKDETDYKIWLDEMVNRSKFNYNTEVTTDDQILTLSSCYTADGIRVAVHAKLIKKEVR